MKGKDMSHSKMLELQPAQYVYFIDSFSDFYD